VVESRRGGTVWDSISYDPDLNLLYFGVGNGTPWDRPARSPRGGDNLFICSVVALKPDTGRIRLAHQETPRRWPGIDDSNQSIISRRPAPSTAPAKVLLHAPRTASSTLLDRATGGIALRESRTPPSRGQLYRFENWSRVVNAARHLRKIKNPVRLWPRTGRRAHLALHVLRPLTGLAYIPVSDSGFLYKSAQHPVKSALAYNVGIDFVAAGMPQKPEIQESRPRQHQRGTFLPGIPRKQKEIWARGSQDPNERRTALHCGPIWF